MELDVGYLSLAAICCFILIIGLVLAWKIDNDLPFAFVAVSIALIVFFGFLNLGSSIRTSIAGATIIEYLVIVGIVSFFKNGLETLPPITKTLIKSFTAIVAVVIGFYFAGSAYVEVYGSGSGAGGSF